MTAINLERHRKYKVKCGTCDSYDLSFEDIVQFSEKELTGKIPILVKGRYKKNTFRSVHRCKNCGRVTLYSVVEK